eukprot:12768462-Heterocapsa_arctica.AAC.1
MGKVGDILKKTTGGADGISFLKDDDGNIHRDTGMIKQTLFDHFNEVYGGGEDMEEMMTMDGDPIRLLPEEVVEAVQRLSVHKSHPA